MPLVPFAKPSHFRMASWNCGRHNRAEHNKRALLIFLFCVFTGTRIAPIDGQPSRLKCGAIARLKSGE